MKKKFKKKFKFDFLFQDFLFFSILLGLGFSIFDSKIQIRFQVPDLFEKAETEREREKKIRENTVISVFEYTLNFFKKIKKIRFTVLN